MSHPDVFAGLLQMPYPSVDEWRKRLEQRNEQPDRLHLLAVDGDDVVASGGIFPFTHTLRTRHSAGLGISVLPSRQKQGIGSEMMRRLLDWADNWMAYLRVELHVYVDNERAIALYKRFGFVLEGTHRAHALRDGVYVDTHTMARFHPNPPKLPQVTGGEA